jgi:hypothetical protein
MTFLQVHRGSDGWSAHFALMMHRYRLEVPAVWRTHLSRTKVKGALSDEEIEVKLTCSTLVIVLYNVATSLLIWIYSRSFGQMSISSIILFPVPSMGRFHWHCENILQSCYFFRVNFEFPAIWRKKIFSEKAISWDSSQEGRVMTPAGTTDRPTNHGIELCVRRRLLPWTCRTDSS